MNAHMEWEWRTNLSTEHKNTCMLLFFKKTKSKKSVEWGGEIARVNCFKSFGDKNSCFPFPALIGEKKTTAADSVKQGSIGCVTIGR